MGRKKIEIRKIERKEARQVCFSKRRQGMFKKASELSILCGAMVAIVTFSPAGRPFSFGSPSFKDVINRFITLIAHDDAGSESCDSSSGDIDAMEGKKLECLELEELIESEIKKKKILQEATESDMDGGVMHWLTMKAYSSGLDELHEFQKKLVAIEDVVKEMIREVLEDERHPPKPYPPAFMSLASKYLLDKEVAMPISVAAPYPSIGLADGPYVNDSSPSGIHVAGTSLNCANDQLDG
ncbi:hypothetical protein BS78_01G345400 [Paspalum vaginatum]|nr:hypothetical protein BS78_01G345400 [Paspalum vaginatum]